MEEILIDIGLILAYLMIAFAALTAIGFGVKKMMIKTNNSKKTLYTIGGLVVIFIIAYLLASEKTISTRTITPATAKKVGMGIISFYILAIGAIGSILYAELSKIFSK
tara:strand:+ start:16 stop:339 length:324 start_codon:yes stop_codon:yes gene_type:complete